MRFQQILKHFHDHIRSKTNRFFFEENSNLSLRLLLIGHQWSQILNILNFKDCYSNSCSYQDLRMFYLFLLLNLNTNPSIIVVTNYCIEAILILTSFDPLTTYRLALLLLNNIIQSLFLYYFYPNSSIIILMNLFLKILYFLHYLKRESQGPFLLICYFYCYHDSFKK